MSIRDNIEDIMKEIQNGDTGLADTIQSKAVEAIKAGEGSSEWIEYMEIFSKDEKQLARLEPTDETQGDFDMDVARTYLVGNGMCGAATTGSNLNFGIADKLDEGLND
jgi:hypothetical protein